jgi:hypothetical protein
VAVLPPPPPSLHTAPYKSRATDNPRPDRSLEGIAAGEDVHIASAYTIADADTASYTLIHRS